MRLLGCGNFVVFAINNGEVMHMREKLSQARLVNFKQLVELGIKISRPHIWRLESANKFPRRIYLSPQKVFWFESEILDWLEQRAAERVERIYKYHD
jgi:prophage regulatory protein